jgi:hypothetical protein
MTDTKQDGLSDQISRAFEIADDSMLELLYSHCVQSDKPSVLYLAGDGQQEVARIEDADQAIRDALEGLEPRGLASLEFDEAGQYIAIHERAIEQKVRSPAAAVQPELDCLSHDRLRKHAEEAKGTPMMVPAGLILSLFDRLDALGDLLQRERSEAEQAAYSAPFTTDVPQCCGTPEVCDTPCGWPAVPAVEAEPPPIRVKTWEKIILEQHPNYPLEHVPALMKVKAMEVEIACLRSENDAMRRALSTPPASAAPTGFAELVGWQMIKRPDVFYPESRRPTDINNFRPVYAASAAPVVPENPDELEPPELLASCLITAWCNAHGKQIPWAKAIEITAIVTKMPEDEKARLLALD